MTAPTSIDLGISLVDALNAHSFDKWSESVAPDFIANYPGAVNLDAMAARQFNEVFLAAFSDLHFDIEWRVQAGDTTVTVWKGEGTHDAPLVTPKGTIPATGKRGVVRGVLITTLRNGKVAREDTFWNVLDLLTQLGVA